jgi:two-component system, chemotaxis family, protein-glutamate methylesterase/glutaminase
VKVAEDGEMLRPGVVYLAPDDHHLGVSPDAAVALSDAPAIGGFRPSADFLFGSLSDSFRSSGLAIILTGMGRDGLVGLQKVRATGGTIIAQNEGSSVVFGMPGVAVEYGLADSILTPEEIGRALVGAIRK